MHEASDHATTPSTGPSSPLARLPRRLHHNAFVVADLERTRRFYEDVLGLPLVATWAEQEHMAGVDMTYCHAFFGLGDGGALAFFQFADPAHRERFAAPAEPSPFVHLALEVDADTQAELARRLTDAGTPPARIDHGYCVSIYTSDPDGLLLEFTCDPDDVGAIAAARRADAHDVLARWLAGDHTPNNDVRPHE